MSSLVSGVSPSIYIYSSELAACIGLNPYKKKWEAFFQVFARLEGGSLLRAAHCRAQQLGHDILSDDFKIQQVQQAHPNFQQACQQLQNENIENSEQLRQTVDNFQFTAKAEERDLRTQTKQLKDQVQQKRVESETILDPTVHMQHQDQIRALDEQISQREQELEYLKLASKHIVSQKQTQFGKDRETVCVNQNLVGCITDNNSAFHSKILGTQPRSWGIGGRIDGYRNGVLIEIKHRKTRLYDPLPRYDWVQVQAYMQILNADRVIVIQCLVNEDGHTERKETEVLRNQTFWDTEVMPELQQFVSALDLFCRDTLSQDRWLQTPDSKKVYLFNGLLKKMKTNRK